MFKTISRSLTRSRNQKGFTLVELMVVVVILGILAALVVPTLSGQVDRAKDNRSIADMKTIHNALQLHFADKNQYPENLGALSSEGLHQAADMKDAWENAFIYTPTPATGRRTGFTLLTGGADKNIATTADNIFSSNTIQPQRGE